MSVAVAPMALNLALLAELDPSSRDRDRLHAVLAWRDDGDAIYQPLIAPASVPTAGLCQLPDLDLQAAPEQLTFDLGDLGPARASSCGLTWRTLALPTIPPELRHLPPSRLVRELAQRLAG